MNAWRSETYLYFDIVVNGFGAQQRRQSQNVRPPYKPRHGFQVRQPIFKYNHNKNYAMILSFYL